MDTYVAFANSYDKLTADVPYGAFADFYEQIFDRFAVKPRSLIDLACGTATLTEIFCKRGYDMIAVDSSPDMLAVAMDKFSDAELKPLILCQDLAQLDLYGTVDAAYCSLDAINYIPDSILPQVFQRVNLFLEPGGLFIFDVNTPEKLKKLDGQMFIDETENDYCVWRAEIDNSMNACVYGMDLFQRSGKLWKRSKEEHIEYMHTNEELSEMLNDAGFKNITLFAELKLVPPEKGEQRVFFVAQKKN